MTERNLAADTQRRIYMRAFHISSVPDSLKKAVLHISTFQILLQRGVVGSVYLYKSVIKKKSKFLLVAAEKEHVHIISKKTASGWQSSIHAIILSAVWAPRCSIWKWGGYASSQLDGDLQRIFHQSDGFLDTINQNGLIFPILLRLVPTSY